MHSKRHCHVIIVWLESLANSRPMNNYNFIVKCECQTVAWSIKSCRSIWLQVNKTSMYESNKTDKRHDVAFVLHRLLVPLPLSGDTRTRINNRLAETSTIANMHYTSRLIKSCKLSWYYLVVISVRMSISIWINACYIIRRVLHRTAHWLTRDAHHISELYDKKKHTIRTNRFDWHTFFPLLFLTYSSF